MEIVFGAHFVISCDEIFDKYATYIDKHVHFWYNIFDFIKCESEVIMKITNKTIVLITTLSIVLSLAFIAVSLMIYLDDDLYLTTDETIGSESTYLSIDSTEILTSPAASSEIETDSTKVPETTKQETQPEISATVTAAPDTTQEETTWEETTIEETTVVTTIEETTAVEMTEVETTVEETTVEGTTEAETTATETTAEETTVEITQEETAPPIDTTPETTVHTHSYSSWQIDYMPTCEKEGAIVRECSCGKKEYLPLPASGHTEKTLPAANATCTAAGKTEGLICSACDKIFIEQTSIPKLECNYENSICIYCGRSKEPIVSLTAPYAGLYRADTLECLYATASNVKTPPASLTKMITACVAIKNLPLNTVITVSSELTLVPKYSSLCYIYQGHKIKLYDLLTGMLLCSGNDAAYTIAAYVGRHVSGNNNMSDREAIDFFCALMNDYANEIGVKNTNFTTPDGSDSENQYSTVEDIAIITAHAMKNKTISEIVSMHYKKVVFASGQIAKWTNTNELINPDSVYYTEGVTGFKTGGTEKAGKCLSATFTVAGVEYIAIVMGCDNNDARYENILQLIGVITKE